MAAPYWSGRYRQKSFGARSLSEKSPGQPFFSGSLKQN
jgi:hypothetical protein